MLTAIVQRAGHLPSAAKPLICLMKPTFAAKPFGRKRKHLADTAQSCRGLSAQGEQEAGSAKCDVRFLSKPALRFYVPFERGADGKRTARDLRLPPEADRVAATPSASSQRPTVTTVANEATSRSDAAAEAARSSCRPLEPSWRLRAGPHAPPARYGPRSAPATPGPSRRSCSGGPVAMNPTSPSNSASPSVRSTPTSTARGRQSHAPAACHLIEVCQLIAGY